MTIDPDLAARLEAKIDDLMNGLVVLWGEIAAATPPDEERPVRHSSALLRRQLNTLSHIMMRLEREHDALCRYEQEAEDW
jgi:hypothetical protein